MLKANLRNNLYSKTGYILSIYTQKKKFSLYLCFLIESTILDVSLSNCIHELYYRNFTCTCYCVNNVASIMQASHCPELDTRWTHDYENVQIRVWSYIHRAIREGIWSHRMTIGWVSQASATTSWAMAKSLACQKNARRPCEGSLSCWIRVSDLPFVRPSCGHRGKSCHLRLYLV